MTTMQTINVSEATGPVLDWLVTSIEVPDALRYGVQDWREQRTRTVKNGEYLYRWSQSWAQGGPIIGQERINLHLLDDKPDIWAASLGNPWKALPNVFSRLGPTPLIAACRCYVASKLGDTAEVPEELL
jgi:hypothetical protein